LLIVFNVLAMLSIGIFVLPITVCLIVACASTKVAPAVYPDALASSAPR
jgi:hypothetical protein